MPNCPDCQASFQVTDGRTIPWECPVCHERFVRGYAGLRMIASGTMGEVYEGRDSLMNNRRVAIKFPCSNVPEAARRFRREIEASTRLRHENIVRGYEHGQEAGRPFLVMEFVEGQRLDELVNAGHPLPPRRVASYLCDLAAGLSFAESLSVINRDIKPSNILITADDRAKILDYGLALIADLDGSGHDATRAGITLGTPAYLAPEQFVDPHHVTIAADVYSLGCAIFFCLTARQPFLDLDAAGLHHRHATDPRPSIRQSRRDVSAEFECLVQRMMAIAPGERPRPAEIRELAAAVLKDAQPQSLSAAEVAADASFDVKCPTCGEVYHLDRSALGNVLPCSSPHCRPFKVEPHLIVGASPRALNDSLSYVEAVAVDDDEFHPSKWTPAQDPLIITGGSASETARPRQRHIETPGFVDSDPVSADPAGPTSVDAEDSFEAAFGGRAAAFGSSAATFGEPEDFYHRRRPVLWRRWLAAGVVLAGVLGAMGQMAYRRLHPPPDVVWEHVVKDEFGLSHWEAARASFERFGRDFPKNRQAPHVPFFIDLCDAQVASSAEPAQALLERLRGIYRRYRDEEAYALYANYLYDLTQKPVERFLDEAKRSHDPAKIDQAKAAFELFSTIAKSMKDDWVPERVRKVADLLKASDEQVQRDRSRDLVLADLKNLCASNSTVDPDKAYERYEALKHAYPQLGRDRQLDDALRQAEDFEVRQVTYEAASPSADESAKPMTDDRAGARAATLWLLNKTVATRDKEVRDSAVVLGLARGVLYAFDSQGAFLWARRLGIDSAGLPVRIPETTTSPPLLLAASAAEGRLLALEEGTGMVRWSYQFDGAIFTAPTIVSTTAADGDSGSRTWGLLPTADGDVHVLELVLGKRLGTIHLNKPLSTGGTYDPATRLVYFPADNKRLFAIDPSAFEDSARPTCRSVLFTNHAGGSLRSEPIVAGPYLILNQAAGFDTTLLRVFRLYESGFRTQHDAPLKEETLAGWTWHPPLVSPDRVTFVTDRGAVGAYGVNLNIDASEEEALYRMIDDREAITTGDSPLRSLAVSSQEQLLWVVTGGKLQKRCLDVLDQRITTQWPKPGDATIVAGIPVQEAQVSDDNQVLYLTLMSPDGCGYTLSAVDSEQGKTLWSCALGHSLRVDPIVRDGEVLLVDRGGQIWRLKTPQGMVSTGQTIPPIYPVVKGFATADTIASQFYLLGAAASPSHIAAVIDSGRQLALLDMVPARDPKRPPLKWQNITLPARIAGQPCLLGRRMAVSCEDGQIHLCDLEPQSSPRQWPTYRWRSAAGMIGEPPVLVSTGDNSLVALTDHGSMRRLELQRADAGLWRFHELGNPVKLSSAGFLPPDFTGDHLIVAGRDGTLHGVRLTGSAVDHWTVSLPGRPSMPPVIHGQSALVVLDSRKIACVDLSSQELLWISGPTGGRICGQPVACEEGFLIADESRQLTIIGRDDGREHTRREMPFGSAPAASAVPFGRRQFLVPLDDGSLIVLAPDVKPKLAEAPR